MMVKNWRISFPVHSHSSAELKHNYPRVLLVGRGSRYLMLCWKTVTLAGNFTVNLRDTLNQTLPKKERRRRRSFPMFGLMLSEAAVCTESDAATSLDIWGALLHSWAVFSALQWKCCRSRTLKHVRPSGAQQTLFSSPMLLLPSLTFPGISEEFYSQFLIKSLQGSSGSCSCLQTGLSVTSSRSSKCSNSCQNGSLDIYELFVIAMA